MVGYEVGLEESSNYFVKFFFYLKIYQNNFKKIILSKKNLNFAQFSFETQY